MSAYARPQWTGKRGGFSQDPGLDSSECPSCLHFHAPSFIGCNGHREPSEVRCDVVIGEIQCDRPGNHIGPHEALSQLLRVEWEVLGELSGARWRYSVDGTEWTRNGEQMLP